MARPIRKDRARPSCRTNLLSFITHAFCFALGSVVTSTMCSPLCSSKSQEHSFVSHQDLAACCRTANATFSVPDIPWRNVDKAFSLDNNGAITNSQVLEHDSSLSHGRSPTKKICFVKSIFGESAAKVDQVPDALLANESITSQRGTNFEFFLFTNLPNLTANNWNITVLSDLPYKSNIVKSRYPKFMAWQIPLIQSQCRLVAYTDGVWMPTATAQVFEGFYSQITKSDSGVMQYSRKRVKGPLDELQQIRKSKKDTIENVAKERAWFLNQCGFREFSTVYLNTVILYDPNNLLFQRTMTLLWARYSTEQGSWRDQPLYSFVMDQLSMKPLEMAAKAFTKKGEVGFNGHTYA